MKKLLIGLGAVTAALIAAAMLSIPPKLSAAATTPTLPEDLDAWLAESEAASPYPLVPDTEKRIVWQTPGERSDYVVVYLHGFSASRQEIAPTAEMVAEQLGANLFETRLAGHGRTDGAMVDVTAEDWIDDGIEALAIAQHLGEKIVLVTVSTGSTIAIALADHPLMASVDTLVMLAPNFMPAAPNAEMVTGPGGPILMRLIVGETRSWEPRNELQAKYWSTRYPSSTSVEVMRLVDLANATLPLDLPFKVITISAENDQVVSLDATRAALEQIEAVHSELLILPVTDNAGNHVIAGDVLAPRERTLSIVDTIVRFVSDSS
ncbi:MAG: alpha/beta fold hydrolase [Pseudomonadota bacterium]